MDRKKLIKFLMTYLEIKSNLIHSVNLHDSPEAEFFRIEIKITKKEKSNLIELFPGPEKKALKKKLLGQHQVP